MARKLPWAASATSALATTSTASTARPVKRLKSEPGQTTIKTETTGTGIKHEPNNPALFSSSPGQSTPRKATRSAQRPRTRDGSTSPPPAPPPVCFMREGLDNDDIYMMVEDEFNEIARSYTAHLHYNEYKRLMREAKEKKRAILKVPKDASFEVKHKFARKGLDERQDVGLNGVGVGGGLVDSDDEERKIADAEKEIVEPWAGTTLAGLMDGNGSQKRSLKGLDSLSSHSRAAQGFGPSTSQEASQTRPSVKPSMKPGPRDKDDHTSADASIRRPSESGNIAGGIGATRVSRSMASTEITVESSSTSRNPVADRPIRGARSTKISKHENGTKTANGETFAKDRPASQRHSDQIARSVKVEESAPASTLRSKANPSSKLRSFIDSLDDFDDSKYGNNQTGIKSESHAPEKPRIKREREGTGNTKEVKKKTRRYDEIPIFLA